VRVLKQLPGRLDPDEHDARVDRVRTQGEHAQDLYQRRGVFVGHVETSCREYWYACIFLPLRMMYACMVEGSLIIRCHSATGTLSRHMSGVVIDGG
jgi:hypothetical protein